jgi:hypothetical protein
VRWISFTQVTKTSTIPIAVCKPINYQLARNSATSKQGFGMISNMPKVANHTTLFQCACGNLNAG